MICPRQKTWGWTAVHTCLRLASQQQVNGQPSPGAESSGQLCAIGRSEGSGDSPLWEKLEQFQREHLGFRQRIRVTSSGVPYTWRWELLKGRKPLRVCLKWVLYSPFGAQGAEKQLEASKSMKAEPMTRPLKRVLLPLTTAIWFFVTSVFVWHFSLLVSLLFALHNHSRADGPSQRVVKSFYKMSM